MHKLLATFLGLCLLPLLSPAQVRHWSRYYTRNARQLFIGAEATYAYTVEHDSLGRPVARGVEVDGRFIPQIFWEYDEMGNVQLERRVDSLGNGLHAEFWRYDAWGNLAEHYIGTDVGDLERCARYVYEQGRLVRCDRACTGGDYGYYDLWVYDEKGHLLRQETHFEDPDRPMVEAATYGYDKQLGQWQRYVTNGYQACCDSNCREFLLERSGTGSRSPRTVRRAFDAAGRETMTEDFDSTSGYMWRRQATYDRQGALLTETLTQGYPFQYFQVRRDYDSLPRPNWLEREYYPVSYRLQFTKRTFIDSLGRPVFILQDAAPQRVVLQYDAGGRLSRKLEITDRTDLLQGFLPTLHQDKKQRRKVIQPPGHLPPAQLPPRTAMRDTLAWVYAHDADDSLVRVACEGMATVQPNAMPPYEPQAGSLPWLTQGQFDTLSHEWRGDSTFLELRRRSEWVGMTDVQVRSTVLCGGVPVSVVESDSGGKVWVEWRHRDAGKPTPPTPLPGAGEPARQLDSLMRLHSTVRVTRHLERFQRGDTVFCRAWEAPDKWAYTFAYVGGRLVKEIHPTYVVAHAYTHDANGRLVEHVRGQGRGLVRWCYRYDAQGRVVKEAWFSHDDRLQEAYDYFYTGSRSVVKDRLPLEDRQETVARVEDW